MPTALKRTTINHPPAIRRGLCPAAREWPDDGACDLRLLQHIVEDWANAAEERQAERRRLRAERIRGAAGYSSSSPGAPAKCRRFPVNSGTPFAMAHAAIHRSPTCWAGFPSG